MGHPHVLFREKSATRQHDFGDFTKLKGYSTMSDMTCRISITALLGLTLVGVMGCTDHDAEVKKAQEDFQNTVAANNAEMDSKWFSTWIDLVGHDQGEEVGMRLLLDCQQKGYRLHFGVTDANNFTPAVGDSSEGPSSNRLKAECDNIIKAENRIGSAEAARDKAREKRLDAAYDKAHPKTK
jgi:hypothetical protein